MDKARWQKLLKAIDRGSLRAAAEEIGFTVSGISRSVPTRENELGGALLYRANRAVQPTADCRPLQPTER
ncbi:UNVERIFIED_CONTAM: LysR family transcriptional regulator, partial [Bacteroidetes bacterium 56_B9]